MKVGMPFTVAQQTIEADGVFFVDPTLGDLEIQRYTEDKIEDEYDNMSLTLEGSIGDLEVVYAKYILTEQQIRWLTTLTIFL